MRKTSYVVTFLVTLVILVLNVLSAERPDWIVINEPEVIDGVKTTIRYGLMERCQRNIVEDGRFKYVDYKCRPFPMRVMDRCEQENRNFCTAFTSARYAAELGIGFASVALVALLIGVSTHSRRRRIWRAVAGLVALHATFQLIAFVLITEVYHRHLYAPFDHAQLSAGYYMNAVSWILGMLIAGGVVTTGISADRGHAWAAGNRAYRPISG
ncbi:hypothetical protein PILCRDRAFT_12661 [Piloderma croceum F 1598]|uniref:Uncharacterized protein n=1 Tax=Piloderma croceum (strain F 1598) TaxID=765440 RepID=A0A0C3EVT5_PILCF|nr:hypothetical protein PILCRDRAFT_12661 [Piloderma croceum F 1598]